MKQAFILLWRGLTGILSGVANWFTTILGMRDDSKYGRFLRRAVGTCFAVIMAVVAAVFVIELVETACRKFGIERDTRSSYSYDYQYISRNVRYYPDEYGQDGYLMDGNGKKTLKHIDWIAKPLGYDSLVCYSDGEKRGYFSMYTGQTIVKPTYGHAWVFSEGLAAVEEGGKIKFIDQAGKVVIDKQLPFFNGADGYVFHDGYCIVHNDRRDLFGLIDHKGDWVLQPKYFSIKNCDSLWIVNDGRQEAVLDSKMREVLPLAEADYKFSGDGILAAMPDHTLRGYNRQGELVEDFYIQSIDKLTYQSDQQTTPQQPQFIYDEEGDIIGETDDEEPAYIEEIASVRRYEAASGWYGLMSSEGKIITPPSYTEISAIARDTYLCTTADGARIVLNGQGERVK